MTLLTKQEINECFESVMFNIEVEASRELIARAIESAVIEKIKAQGPAAWAATSEEGIVEALGFNQSKSRFTVPIYRLPEGD